MILHVLRALFILLMAAAGYFFLQQVDPLAVPTWARDYTWLSVAATVTIGVFLVSVDILAPRRKLVVFSGTFLGLLVGLLIAFALSFVVQQLIEQFSIGTGDEQRRRFVQAITMMIGIISCYFSISFILQTKDDFRFVIPYVEFSKQTKGARPILLDTSVLIDGRIIDVAATGIIESQLIVPQFVIDELQVIADSGDKLKRNRGRRGLDVMQKLRAAPNTDIILYDAAARDPDAESLDVDQHLMHLAVEMNARVMTNDFNLNKVAQLRGVNVININDLAAALKPAVLPGEKMAVRLLKAGDEPGQGIGYLDDGTMVVVEGGRESLDKDVEVTVTSALQTKAGKMIFGRMNSKPA